MTPKELTLKFISEYWDMALVPAAMWLMRWWMINKRGFKRISIDLGDSDKPDQDQCDRLLSIVDRQTKILEKIDLDMERLAHVTTSMKEEDVRIRDKFTACLDKISEAVDGLAIMFREYRAYERGRTSTHA